MPLSEEQRNNAMNAFLEQNRRTQGVVELPKELQPYSAPGVDNPYLIYNGQLMQRSSYESLTNTPAGMKNIGTADKPLYVPIGSAADVLQSQKSFKNPKIQDALNTVPDKKANRQFVDALFQEREGRKATESEWRMIDGRTVSDATSFVLGASNASASGQQGGGNVQQSAMQKDPTTTPTNTKFTESKFYKNLPDDMKKLVNSAFSTFTTGTEEQAKLFSESIQAAVNTAEPYFKSVLALTMGEFNAQLAKLNNDYETAVKESERTQKYLNEDIASTRDELNLESQARLAQLNREYQGSVLNLRDEAASRGVTFGTGRGTLQEGLTQAQAGQQEVVQSLQRQQNFQLAELKRKADRGDEQARLELERLGKAKEQTLGAIARGAQEKLGSGALAQIPTLQGYGVSGYEGIGSIEEQKRQDILTGTLQRFEFSKPVI